MVFGVQSGCEMGVLSSVLKTDPPMVDSCYVPSALWLTGCAAAHLDSARIRCAPVGKKSDAAPPE